MAGKTSTRSKRAAPGRPRKFEFDDIVAAAEEVMEEEGFGTLTMRSLASKLGIAHGNLYTYVGHIEDVEAEVLKRLLERLPEPTPGQTDAAALRKEFIAYLNAARRSMVQHPSMLLPRPGTAAWRSFSALSLKWVSALHVFEKDGAATGAGYSAVIAYLGSHAERERAGGPDYLRETFQAFKKVHGEDPALSVIEQSLKSGAQSLDRSLDILIDRLFPSLAGAPRRRSRA